MYCKHCGREMRETDGFCSICGKKQTEVGKGIYSHELTRLRSPKEPRNPKVAAAIGFLMGWILLGPVGYIYLGQWNWFWITFLIQLFAYPLTIFIAYPLLPVVYAIHQYQMAKDVNELLAAPGDTAAPGAGYMDGRPPSAPEER